MDSGSPLVLSVDIKAVPAGYCVTAAGPLGAAEHEVAAASVASLSGAAKDAAGREQGKRLYDALIAGQVRSCLRRHRAQAQQQSKPLRLVVRLPQEPVASGWPLESLHDPTLGEDLALAPDLTLTRGSALWSGSRLARLEPPLKVLVVMPEPTDAQAFGAGALWEAVESAVHPLASKGQAKILRAPSATERGLEETLQSEPWQVIHFTGQGSSRPAARYGTLHLEGTDRRTRAINAQSFVRLCEKCPSLGLVVFQSTHQLPPRQAFEVVTHALLENGLLGVVWLPDFSQPQATALFARELYGAIASTRPLDQAVAAGRRALGTLGQAARGPSSDRFGLGYWAGPVFFAGAKALEAFPDPAVKVAAHVAIQPEPAPEVTDNRAAAPPEPARRSAAEQELERKRAASEFDVFLCHNIADKPAVKEIGLQLMERGILPWLDEWELRPGVPWQQLLEEQIASIKSAAVFVGGEGIGPWQRQELDGFLREFAQRHCPVIPVLLPGAPTQPSLPLFLKGMTWVDFRLRNPNPLERLIWGITGQRPEVS